MRVIRVDVPAENSPNFREGFVPIQQIDKKLIPAEEIAIEKVLVPRCRAFPIQMFLMNLIDRILEFRHKTMRKCVLNDEITFVG